MHTDSCLRVCTPYLRTPARTQVLALQQQLSSAQRKAEMATLELDELKPSLRRLSSGAGCGSPLADAASELERIAKRAAATRLSLASEQQGRQAAEAKLRRSSGGESALREDLRKAEAALAAAEAREGKLRTQLQSAEFALATSERRAAKQHRASLSVDPGRVAKVQEENEALQLQVLAVAVRLASHICVCVCVCVYIYVYVYVYRCRP